MSPDERGRAAAVIPMAQSRSAACRGLRTSSARPQSESSIPVIVRPDTASAYRRLSLHKRRRTIEPQSAGDDRIGQGRDVVAKLVDYKCPHCGAKLQARQSSINSQVKCKACGGRIQLQKSRAWSAIGCGAVALFLSIFACCLIPAGWFGARVGNAPAPVDQVPPRGIPTSPAARQNAEAMPEGTARQISSAPTAQEPTAPRPTEVKPATPTENVTEAVDLEELDRVASSRLSLARALNGKAKHTEARAILETILQKYPGTPTAKEAAELKVRWPAQ